MNSSSRFTHFLPLFFFFFLFLFLGINITLEVEAAPNYLIHACPNTTLFTPNSTYQNNLKTVLSTLNSSSSTSAAAAAAGFSNATSGTAPPDRAYGLFLCRGDVSNATCSDCVATATQEILNRCPNQRVSVIWYDECLLRYSNQSIFSVAEESPAYILYNTANVTDPTRFVDVLAGALNKSTNQASGGVLKKVGAAQTTFNSLNQLYVLTQCTPDLSSSDCNTCLRQSFGNLPTDKQGGRVLMPSCQVRFELYPFYNASAIAASVPPPPPSLVPSPTQLPPPTGPTGKSKNSNVIIIVIVIPAALALLVFFLACCLLRRRARRTYEAVLGETGVTELSDVQSLQYDFASIQAATGNFSQENKLGEGGFGEVFKGRLTNGEEIAVKRLSQGSGQGVQEFKNEVLLVAKLQHRNLVRLLGFCLEGEEKLLVYEFVPNRSLDYFLFDPEKCRELDWLRRYKIIVGIARGMLYLHEDSRLRIIHRDLKASNILLDSDMNPKISDFGMARIFGVEQTQGNTGKVVGTFGYMSPEYAMHGQFSVKSDVYSFGILLLEIISGRKNSSFYETDGGRDLASYAWKHWKDGTPLEVLDPRIRDSYSTNEVVRCVHIALLCVQEDPADRPNMTSIVLMLNSYSVSLQMPEEPAFFLPSRTEQSGSGLKSDQSNNRSMPVSVNEVSITEVYPR